ncbi:BRISC and BRCA1-A complex member 1 isoform X2 [Lagopus muta]|uniref:BRISC and BRCA1-A complex member 1 isoform X2 n=1 Tax=Lagopus muta TaxID=64668 RepID=UPI00209CBC87|nr:BRISC and BRCA1-A complex member 1 isoform X2 [Lagopus muta]
MEPAVSPTLLSVLECRRICMSAGRCTRIFGGAGGCARGSLECRGCCTAVHTCSGCGARPGDATCQQRPENYNSQQPLRGGPLPGCAERGSGGRERLGAMERSCGMDTSGPGSAAEEEEEKAPEQRPRTRSNPEGAEDRALSAQSSVGNRSEGEGEAASSEDSPQGTAAPDGTAWPGPAHPPPEVQVKTPRVNCPEKVIICLDLAEEMALPKLESFNGSKTNALNISQKMIEMFVRTKHKIDKSHEFALVVVNNDATWLSGFTSDPREVCSCLYDLETVVCKSFNLDGLFNLIQQKIELPVTDNVQTIPPPYVVRTILVLGRPGCQPQFSVSEQMKKMLQCPYFFFDVVYIHNGAEEKEDETSWKELYAFFGSLDTKGTNYRYEVTLTGPAVELHNCMAKLLAHPLQRPFQSHAAYSLLEGDEPPEVEATV